MCYHNESFSNSGEIELGYEKEDDKLVFFVKDSSFLFTRV